MSIEDIIRAWKSDEDDKDEKKPENPAGQQDLSDKDLEEVSGGSNNGCLSWVGGASGCAPCRF